MVKTNKKLVSIIGLGYVGLPLLVEFSKYNHVIGIDNDNQKIKLLKKVFLILVTYQISK